MRKGLWLLIIIFLAFDAKGQFITLTNFSGTTFYGSLGVTVTPSGSVSTGGAGCLGPPTEYWAGPSAAGSYSYVCSIPVYRIQVHAAGLNGGPLGAGEYLQMYLNGSPYSLTAADMTSYTECLSSGGPCYLSTGFLMGPVGATTNYNGGDFTITSCAPINNFEVYCNGILYGVAYHVAVDTTPQVGCVRNNGPVCVGDTLKFFNPGDSTGATYFWWGPGGFTSTLQNPFIAGVTMADTGTYHVVKTVGALTDSNTSYVVIKPIPVITVSSNSPICYGTGNTLTLFSGPDSTGETFSWTGPGSFTSTLENPVVTPFVDADTGFYKVVANWNGCLDSATTHVVYAPVPPPPGITGITTYCTGQTFVPFTVTSIPGSTLNWYNVGSGGTPVLPPITVSTAVPGVTTWWVTQTVAGCESQRDSIIVTVHTTPPPPTITGTTVYCQFVPYVPPVAAGVNILWYTAPTGGTGTVATPIINTNVAGTYIIYASQTDTGCESPRASFTITVNPKPAPPDIVDIPDHYCAGQAFVPFTIITGTGVLWYTTPAGGVGSTTAPTLSTIVPGVYTVWASQTVLGCESDRVGITVTVADSVISGFNFQVKFGCQADTVVFTNTSQGTTDYEWEFGDGQSSILKDPIHIYHFQALDTVKLYSRAGYCVDSTIDTINLIHPIHAIFTVDTTITCQGGTVHFTDASIGTSLSYYWNFADGNNSLLNSPSHNYPHTGVYDVFEVVTDFVPCHDTAYHTIFVDSISPIRIDITDSVLCRGTDITFTGVFTGIGNVGVTWILGNGDSIKDVNPLHYAYDQTGPMTITAFALYRACPEISASTSVYIGDQPGIYLGPDTTICKGSGQLTISDLANAGNPNARWIWNTGATTSSIIVTEPGDYSATVSIGGCRASTGVKVSNDCFMNIPNVFTPNGDGLNDYFYPRQYLTSGLIEFNMEIYNRWGELVFRTNSVDGSGWDGRLNNMEQPVGVYVYIIDATFKDGQKEHHQGNVTLLR